VIKKLHEKSTSVNSNAAIYTQLSDLWKSLFTASSKVINLNGKVSNKKYER